MKRIFLFLATNMAIVLVLSITMRLLGVERVEQLGMQYINTRAVERDIYDGPAFRREDVERLARSPVPVRAKL